MPKLVHGKKRRVSNRTGFTLVELLIVIAIIALLATIGFANYRQFVQKGRDAKRQSDLKLIQSALQQYHSDKFGYPTALNQLIAGGYLKAVVADPLPAPYPSYQYEAKPAGCTLTPPTCQDYCLYADLEKSDQQRAGSCLNFAAYELAVTRP